MVGVSPRISFSYDFIQSESVPVEQQHPLRSNSTSIDFDFCVRKSFEQQSSPADELFSDGKIMPIQIKKNNHVLKSLIINQLANPQPSLPIDGSKSFIKKGCPKERKLTSNAEGDDQKQQSGSKSFWKFKRSSSYGSGCRRSLCPNLPLLSRSKSTGSADSAPTVKRPSINSRKIATTKLSQISNFYQKAQLKKFGHGSSVQINPILNVPTPNLFIGLGSIFSTNGKDKSKKKSYASN